MTSPAYQCLICGKPVSRLLGLGATIDVGNGVAESKISVVGYCAVHKQDVLPTFDAQMRELGEIISILDEGVELRPNQAEKWMRFSAEFIDSWAPSNGE